MFIKGSIKKSRLHVINKYIILLSESENHLLDVWKWNAKPIV